MLTSFEHRYHSFHSTRVVCHYEDTRAVPYRDEHYYTPAALSNWRQKGRSFSVKFIPLKYFAYLSIRIIMLFRNSWHMPFPRKLIPPFTPQFSMIVRNSIPVFKFKLLIQKSFQCKFSIISKEDWFALTTKLFYVGSAPAFVLMVTEADYKLFSRFKQLTLNTK